MVSTKSSKNFDAAIKAAHKRDVKNRIQRTEKLVEEQRNHAAQERIRLEAISKHYDDAEPQEKADIDVQKAEVARLDGELGVSEKNLENLHKEDTEEDTNMDREDEENNNGENRFVGSSSNNTTRLPLVDLTAPNGTAKPLIGSDDDDEAIFTPAQAREARGLSYDGKVVAWKVQDRSQPVIVMYGPQNAAKYERSTASKEDDFDEDGIEQFGPDHRVGDEKLNKKFVRRRRELLGITGLAYNCDLHDLQPRVKGAPGRIAPLEIQVKWEIGGRILKTWEVRSSIRHLFNSTKKCDSFIYDAAVWHAGRHEEWQNGKRDAKDRSPTPVPGSRLSPTPQREIKIEIDNGGSVLGGSVQPSKQSKRAAMLQYREQWCDMKGIDPEKMEPAAEGRFLKAWNEIQDSL